MPVRLSLNVTARLGIGNLVLPEVASAHVRRLAHSKAVRLYGSGWLAHSAAMRAVHFLLLNVQGFDLRPGGKHSAAQRRCQADVSRHLKCNQRRVIATFKM
jgi:hypothetical protein